MQLFAHLLVLYIYSPSDPYTTNKPDYEIRATWEYLQRENVTVSLNNGI